MIGFWSRWSIALGVALHLVVVLSLNAVVSIWIDDAFTLDTTRDGVVRAFRQALAFELQPPFYFVSLAAWRWVDDSLLWARMYSVLWTTATLFVAVALSRRWLPELHPGWLVASLALNPYLVWAAGEIRLYALVVFLGGLLLLLLHDAFLEEEPRPALPWLFGAVALVGLYTQYYLGFLLAAAGATLVVTRRWRALAKFIAVMAVVGVAFLPMVLVVLGQLGTHAEVSEPPALHRAVWFVLYHVQEMTVPIYSLKKNGWLLLVVPIVALAVAGLYAGRSRISDRQLSLWAYFAVAFAVYTAAIYVAGASLVTRRHCAGFFVAANLLPLSVITLQRAPLRRGLLILWLGVLAPVTVWGLYQVNEPLAKEGDWRRVAAFIEAREKEGEPIVVFPAEQSLPLSMYYAGSNEILPLPEPYRFDDIHQSVLRDAAHVEEALAVLGPHDRLWVVLTMTPENDTYLGVDYRSELLLEHLSKHYRPVKTQTFLGSQLLLLRSRGDRSQQPAR